MCVCVCVCVYSMYCIMCYSTCVQFVCTCVNGMCLYSVLLLITSCLIQVRSECACHVHVVVFFCVLVHFIMFLVELTPPLSSFSTSSSPLLLLHLLLPSSSPPPSPLSYSTSSSSSLPFTPSLDSWVHNAIRVWKRGNRLKTCTSLIRLC